MPDRRPGKIRRHRAALALRLLLVGVLAAPAAAAADAGRHFVPTGGWHGERADWVSVDGDRIAFGAGRRAHLAAGLDAPVLERSLDAGLPVLDAVLVEATLYVSDGSRVGTLDLREAAPTLSPLRLVPEPRGALRLTRMTDYLIVAEDGYGLRVLALPPPAGMAAPDHAGHAGHAGRQAGPSPGRTIRSLEQVAYHRLEARFRALAAAGSVVYALTGPGAVTILDLGDREHAESSGVAVDPSTRALAAGGTTLYGLTEAGLALIDVGGAPATGAVAVHAGVRGTALQVAGRAIQVAGGDRGLQTFVDRSPTAAIVDVTVGNNFFSPADVTVGPGDTVRWTKASGFHNVEACSPGAGDNRCGVLTSTEVFRSGDATFDPFTFDHTFSVAGTHEYVCVVHAFGGSGMIGSVTVGGGAACGDGNIDPFSEECDDGNVISGDGCEADCTFTTSGELPPTLSLDKLPGDEIALVWGGSCLASDSAAGVYEGTIPDFLTYSQRACDVTGGTTALLPNVNDAFYLVVPHNPSSEGSYGADSAGSPRPTGAVGCRPQRLGSCP